ncbi:MAG: outer membrane lipoprotein-sorting protein [Zetaproteobacteria bacterium]|nr:outer membrane lipoprotein-sorting protein [Zetaproteobacteria bacterium]
MKFTTLLPLSLISFTLLAIPTYSQAETPVENPTGLSIMQAVDQRDDGEDLIQKIDQKLIDKRGGVRERHMIAFRKDYGADSKSISYFLKPANILDTALLTYDYDGVARDDDQWLYLPALKKVRRISSSDRGDYFMGTDFTFEDIKQTPELEDYNWTLLGSEIIDNHDCWKISATPKTEDLQKNLGYTKTISYIRKDILIAVRIDYWDRKAQHLKTLIVDKVEAIDGIWSVRHMVMKNIQSQHITELSFSEQQYNSNLSDRLFSERMLKMGYRAN